MFLDKRSTKEYYPVILIPKTIQDYLHQRSPNPVNWKRPHPPRPWKFLTHIIWVLFALLLSFWMAIAWASAGQILLLGLMAIAIAGQSVGIYVLYDWWKEQNRLQRQDYSRQSRRWNSAQSLLHRARRRKLIKESDKHRQQLKSLLTDKVLPTQKARISLGASEQKFLHCLEYYFKGWVLLAREVLIPQSIFTYQIDLALIEPTTGLSIDIEIDQLYKKETFEPIDFIDNPLEKQRHIFFLERNWIIIRFSSEQVACHPHECAAFVGLIIAYVLGDEQYLERFKRIPPVPSQKRWTKKQARRIALQDKAKKTKQSRIISE
jgi:hypothetical protein